jgi:hypothetical protein
MHPGTLLAAAIVAGWLAPTAHAAPTPAQLCESAMELASGQYAQCRLNAESKHSKAPNLARYTAALAKCSTKLSDAFGKSTTKFGMACAATEPSSEFDAYLQQCSDEVAAAASGGALALRTPFAAPLLKTGQTTAYGAGSDGDLQKGITQGYVDNGDGTITDTSTGLMWEKKSDDGTIHDKDNLYTFIQSIETRLASLNAGGGFAGHTDWRAPNRRELESLVTLEYANPSVSSAFNTRCEPGCTVWNCSCTGPAPYWSSSSYAGGPAGAWVVSFYDGSVFAGDKTANLCNRAVRAGS